MRAQAAAAVATGAAAAGGSPAPAPARRRRVASLAWRLTRLLLLWVTVVWVLCVAGVVVFMHREINRNFDNELEESGLRVLDVATHYLDTLGTPAPGEAPLLEPPPLASHDDLIYRVVDPAGRVLMLPRAAMGARFFAKLPLVPGFANVDGWRVFTARHPTRALLLQVADPRPERRRAVRQVLLGLAAPMLAVLGVLALLLATVARRALRELHVLERQIATRGGNDLHALATDGLPRELQSVADHVNRLLERLAQALDVERALAANAAHELRTPLTAARLRLATALEGDLRAADVRAALASLDTLAHRTEKLLQLSRAESAAVQARPLPLARVAAVVAEEFWDTTPASRERLRLHVPEDGGPVALADLDALAIALRNLVENALRHSTGPVELAVEPPCALVVRDHGAGVAPERLTALRERHVRDSADRAGYGLGLSIVGTIVERVQGRLALRSPLAEGHPGFEARIELPCAP